MSVTIPINPLEGFKLLWGAAPAIINFLSRNNIQVSTTVYLEGCSMYAGDSEGWQQSLKAYATSNQLHALELGRLRIGSQGLSFLQGLLLTQYGTRWLGVMAVLHTISDDYAGADQLYTFLKDLATVEMGQFVLDKDQCEKLWLISREIFADSRYHDEFLHIASACVKVGREKPDIDVLSNIFVTEIVDRGTAFSCYMMAAYHLLQLAETGKPQSHKLFAHGSLGCAQLVFYLTTVCGFHVTLQGDRGTFAYGDPKKNTEVVIKLSNKPSDTWVTGYLVDRLSLDDSVKKLLQSDNQSIALWKSRHKSIPSMSSSTFQIDLNAPRSKAVGEFLLVQIQRVKDRIRRAQIEMYVSAWFADVLHAWFCSSVSLFDVSAGTSNEKVHGTSNAIRFARLKVALDILAPGIIHQEHLDTLELKIDKGSDYMSVKPLWTQLPLEKASLLCSQDHSDTSSIALKGHGCAVQIMADDLVNTAKKIWLCTYLETCPSVLRNLGPDYKWFPLLGKNIPGQAHHITIVFEAIASRLTGRQAQPVHKYALAIASGGFAVCLASNEQVPIQNDPGISISIIKGSIEDPDRKIWEVIQSAGIEYEYDQAPASQSRINGLTIANLSEPKDHFGPCESFHISELRGHSASLLTIVSSGGGQFPLFPRNAINNAASMRNSPGCLGECARQHLTGEEIEAVELILGDNVLTMGTIMPGKKLQVIPASHNITVQRATLSYGTPGDTMMLTEGACVHCAVRAALVEGCCRLII